MNIYGKKSLQWCFLVTCFFIAVVQIRQFYIDIAQFPFYSIKYSLYESFEVSDWLINYQGGFVRRGLAGELLWQIYQYHAYPVVFVIILIGSICLVTLTILCIKIFRSLGLPLLMMMFPIFLYYPYYGLYNGILASRRDALMLLLSFLLFKAFKNYMKERNNLFFIWILSALILLLHEGFFFPVFPILMVLTMVHYGTSISKMFGKLVMLWWPVVVVMLAIVYWHGNEKTPELIWQSWMPCFLSYPLSNTIPSIGLGPQCLSWSLIENHNLGFSITWQTDFIRGIPVWPVTIYLFLAIYFLFTRMFSIKIENGNKQVDNIQMSNIIILQMLFTMPMLGFVACDLYRSIPYFCITSVFLCYLFKEQWNMPSFINSISIWLQQKIDKSVLLNNGWCYYLILITLPFNLLNATLGGMFPFIPFDLKGQLLETVMKWL